MAKKDNKINMPMSTAGITRYFDDYETSIILQPTHVIALVAAITMVVILLHLYGNSFLGI